MAYLGFALNNLDSSDMVLRIEIVSRKDFGWLKSLAKRSQIPHLLAAVYDFESRTISLRVVTLNINSRILASESLYFNRLFKKVAKESGKKEATLEINESEEAALMDLLNFMYINNLSASTYRELEGVRMMAEKLEVTSCIEYGKKLTMSLQHELYEGEPSCASMAEEVKPLKDAAKRYLIERHRDLHKSRNEALGLPISALEIVLSSPDLRVDSENYVYRLILSYAHNKDTSTSIRYERTSFPKRLYRFIHFPYLNLDTIVRGQPYFLDFFLLDEMHGKDDGARAHETKRVYKYHPIKVLHRAYAPLPSSVVYLNLAKQDLENLFQSKATLRSHTFTLGSNQGPSLLLEALLWSSSNHFCLCLCGLVNLQAPLVIDYEFAVLTQFKASLKEYKIMSKRTIRKPKGKLVKGDDPPKPNGIGVSWDNLMADDSEYFIDGILHLRADMTLKN